MAMHDHDHVTKCIEVDSTRDSAVARVYLAHRYDNRHLYYYPWTTRVTLGIVIRQIYIP